MGEARAFYSESRLRSFGSSDTTGCYPHTAGPIGWCNAGRCWDCPRKENLPGAKQRRNSRGEEGGRGGGPLPRPGLEQPAVRQQIHSGDLSVRLT
jgi:hypothetical protein